MAAYNTETVLSVHHWNDTLFSFTTTRNKGLRFRSGHFLMIGLEVDEKPLVRAYSVLDRKDEAEAALKAFDKYFEDEPVPTLSPSRQRESLAIAWIRIEMQRHRLVRAGKVAARWLDLEPALPPI